MGSKDQGFVRLSFLVCLSLVLSACGGGGGGGDSAGSQTSTPAPATPAPTAPPATTVTLSYGTKQVNLNWSAASGATFYRVLKNPNNSSGYTAVSGDLTATSYSETISVHLADWVNTSYIVRACNSIGCTDSSAAFLLPTASANAIGYFKASNTGTNDFFGMVIAISSDGNTLAVGAPNESSNATGIGGNQADNSASAAGAVYVFAKSGTTWSQQAYVKASNTEADDRFGASLALSSDGGVLAVGAPGEDSNAAGVNGNAANNLALGAGAAYVFIRTGTTWTQHAYIKSANSVFDGRFGTSVALTADGNTLLAGATYESTGGAVYEFVRSGVSWVQQGYIRATNGSGNGLFGSNIALTGDGNTAAISAPAESSNATGVNGNQSDTSAPQSGAVYVYVRNLVPWVQQAYIKASNTDAQDYFGASLALSADGNTLAVGAGGEDSNATGINGNQADNSALDAGAVYVFARTGTTWAQQAYVKSSNQESGDSFARVALSADGNTLAVGTPGEDSAARGVNGNQIDNGVPGSGAVFMFTRTGTSWSQRAYVKSPYTRTGDSFGHAISMSGDASTLFVGAFAESSNTTGVNSAPVPNSFTLSGAAYIY